MVSLGRHARRSGRILSQITRTKYGLISASSIADDKDIVPWQEDAKDQLVFLGVDAQYFAAALLPGREDAKDISYSSCCSNASWALSLRIATS